MNTQLICVICIKQINMFSHFILDYTEHNFLFPPLILDSTKNIYYNFFIHERWKHEKLQKSFGGGIPSQDDKSYKLYLFMCPYFANRGPEPI